MAHSPGQMMGFTNPDGLGYPPPQQNGVYPPTPPPGGGQYPPALPSGDMAYPPPYPPQPGWAAPSSQQPSVTQPPPLPQSSAYSNPAQPPPLPHQTQTYPPPPNPGYPLNSQPFGPPPLAVNMYPPPKPPGGSNVPSWEKSSQNANFQPPYAPPMAPQAQPAPLVYNPVPSSPGTQQTVLGYMVPPGMFGLPPPPPPLSGRKKAVLIGINYTNHPTAKLSGCINDARCMKYLLQTKFGFLEHQIVMLTDDNPDPNYSPTRRNVLNSLGWLIIGAQPGDSLFFHFSGHGSQQTDTSGDEIDGMDETICPVDWETNGMVVDDELHAEVAAKLPYGVRLTAVMDCCHSGTGMDLPYTYYRNKQGRIQPEIDQVAIRNKRETAAQVVLFSGCADSQTSADTKGMSGGVCTGAATFSFIQAIERHYPNLTFESLLDNMSAALKAKGYEQTAYMSSGHPLNLRMPFHI